MTTELNEITAKLKNALALLEECDQSACDLTNSGALDYKESSVLSTFFYKALAGTRDLIRYLESSKND